MKSYLWPFPQFGNLFIKEMYQKKICYTLYLPPVNDQKKITYHIIQGLFCSQSVLRMCMVVFPSECFVFQISLLLQVSVRIRVL